MLPKANLQGFLHGWFNTINVTRSLIFRIHYFEANHVAMYNL